MFAQAIDQLIQIVKDTSSNRACGITDQVLKMRTPPPLEQGSQGSDVWLFMADVNRVRTRRTTANPLVRS